MSNQAAWIPEAKAPFVVKEAPMPKASEGEVVLKNHAFAINPVECKVSTFSINIRHVHSFNTNLCSLGFEQGRSRNTA